MLTGPVPDSSAAQKSDSDDPAIAASAGMCRFTAGGSGPERTLIIGNLLTGMGGAQYGAILISGGRIVELVPENGIEFAAGDAAVFDCGRNYVSPGLINPHEHTRYSFQMLTAQDREKLPVYAHRDEWIPESGFGDGADKIRYKDGTDDAKTLVWSPRSNLALYGETADIPALLRENVRIAIGTDWSVSGSYNMLEELRCAAELYGSGSDSSALSSAALWRMATGNGAYALGLEAVTGKLEAGLAADVMVFRKLSDDPFDDLLRATAAEVLATFVNGRLRSGSREGFSGALPNDCRFAVGTHFVCAELPDAARGLPFGFGEVLQANRKEDIVPLYREDHRPFPNQAVCAVQTRTHPES